MPALPMLTERKSEFGASEATSRQQDRTGLLLFHPESNRLSGERSADVHGEITVEAVAKEAGIQYAAQHRRGRTIVLKFLITLSGFVSHNRYAAIPRGN